MNSRRAWLIWAVGVFAYVVAVLQRSSLGIAGVEASERFDSGAAALSSLGVLQLVVYAGLQIPIGVLIDRIGPKRLVVSGALLMAIGQAVVALSPDLGGAILGRVLVGAGDAAIFTSVLRLTNTWFRPSRVPQLTQWLGNLGQLGQVLSAVPFAILLHAEGWTPAFLSIASISLLSFVLCLAVLSDGRGVLPNSAGAADMRSALRALGESFRRPGTQLGFWAHFTTQSPGTVFALFWGVPFLVYGLGYDAAFASAMIALMVVAALLVGPLLALLMVRYPLRRSSLALGIVALIGVVWTAVLLWPTPAPAWLVVLLAIALGVGGPASQIGFDFARTFNPSRRLGSANGIVNVGGFTASFIMMLLIGVVLDLSSPAGAGTDPSELYTFDGFRLAMLVQYPVVGFGVVMLIHARRRTRRLMLQEEGIAVGPFWVALFRRLGLQRFRRRGL
ncbi:nitrate/nitrite transporter [Amnibacterium flavum]|uniref:MFS transporter n=1 Tax=Amnibacterium flavum TaxID=2173173 RepID=A0A2V1HNQ2_9MICO|nr:MFS transporter [Amnibacterium flavum]PVZ94263.1 MFS transporter [Amnibacterium flavum]